MLEKRLLFNRDQVFQAWILTAILPLVSTVNSSELEISLEKLKTAVNERHDAVEESMKAAFDIMNAHHESLEPISGVYFIGYQDGTVTAFKDYETPDLTPSYTALLETPTPKDWPTLVYDYYESSDPAVTNQNRADAEAQKAADVAFWTSSRDDYLMSYEPAVSTVVTVRDPVETHRAYWEWWVQQRKDAIESGTHPDVARPDFSGLTGVFQEGSISPAKAAELNSSNSILDSINKNLSDAQGAAVSSYSSPSEQDDLFEEWYAWWDMDAERNAQREQELIVAYEQDYPQRGTRLEDYLNSPDYQQKERKYEYYSELTDFDGTPTDSLSGFYPCGAQFQKAEIQWGATGGDFESVLETLNQVARELERISPFFVSTPNSSTAASSDEDYVNHIRVDGRSDSWIPIGAVNRTNYRQQMLKMAARINRLRCLKWPMMHRAPRGETVVTSSAGSSLQFGVHTMNFYGNEFSGLSSLAWRSTSRAFLSRYSAYDSATSTQITGARVHSYTPFVGSRTTLGDLYLRSSYSYGGRRLTYQNEGVGKEWSDVEMKLLTVADTSVSGLSYEYEVESQATPPSEWVAISLYDLDYPGALEDYAPFKKDLAGLMVKASAVEPTDSFTSGKTFEIPFFEEGNEVKFRYEPTEWLPKVTQNDGHTGSIALDFEVVCHPNFQHSFDLDGFLAESFSPSMRIDQSGGSCRLVFPIDTSIGIAGEETLLALNLSSGEGNPEFLKYPFWGLLSIEGDASRLEIESGSPSREISAIYRRNYLGGFELVEDPGSIYSDQTREPMVKIEGPQVDLVFRWDGPYSMTLTFKDKSGNEVGEYSVRMAGNAADLYLTTEDYPESLATVEVYRGPDQIGTLRFTDEYSALASVDGERWSYEDLSNGAKTLVRGDISSESTTYLLDGDTITTISNDPVGTKGRVGGYSKIPVSAFASWSQGGKSITSAVYEYEAPATEIDDQGWGGGAVWPPHDGIYTYTNASDPVAPMPSLSAFSGSYWESDGEIIEYEKDGAVKSHQFTYAGLPASRTFDLSGSVVSDTLTVDNHTLSVATSTYSSDGATITTVSNGVTTTTEFYTSSAGSGLPWQVKSIENPRGKTTFVYEQFPEGEVVVQSTFDPSGVGPNQVSETKLSENGAMISETQSSGGVTFSETIASGHGGGFLGRPTDFNFTQSGVSSQAAIGYTDTGEVSRIEYPSGRRDDLKWDAWGRLGPGTGIDGVGLNPSYDGTDFSASFGGKSISVEREIDGTFVSSSSDIGKGSLVSKIPGTNQFEFSLPNEGGRGVGSVSHPDGAPLSVSPGLGRPGSLIDYSVEQVGGFWCIATKTTATNENGLPTAAWEKRYVNGYGQLLRVETPHPSGQGTVATDYTYDLTERTITITPPAPSVPQKIIYDADWENYTVQTGAAGGPSFSSTTTQEGSVLTTVTEVNNEVVSTTKRDISTGATESVPWAQPNPVFSSTVSADGNQHTFTSRNGDSATITTSRHGVVSITGTRNGVPFTMDASDRDKFGMLNSLSISPGGGVGAHQVSFTDTNRISEISGPAVSASFNTSFEGEGVNIAGSDHISGQSIGSLVNKAGDLEKMLRVDRQNLDFSGSILDGTFTAAVNGASGQLLTMDFGPTGALLSKNRNDGSGTNYSWHGDGRLQSMSRVDSSGATYDFDYSYDPDNGLPIGYQVGELASLAMEREPDGTIRKITKADMLPQEGPYSSVVDIPEYHEGQPALEVFSGVLAGFSIDRDFNPATGALTSVRLLQNGQLVHEIQWDDFGSGRLQRVEAPMVSYAGTYSYLDFETTLSSNFGDQRRILLQDGSGRLGRVSTQAGGNAYHASISYLGGSPKRQTITGGGRNIRWTYDYNSGQLQEAGSNRGDRLVYNHDGMGNRPAWSATGANQYQLYRSPNGSDYVVAGTVEPGAEVYIRHGDPGPGITLGGTQVLVNPDGSFRARFGSPASGSVQSIPIKVVAILRGEGTNGTDAVSREDFVLALAPSEGAMSYGAHGALATDPRWIYNWSAEGRLNGMETRESAVTAGVENVRLQFAYDHEGRRIWKKSESLSQDGTTVNKTVTTRFVYDDWLLLGEFREEIDHLEGGSPVTSERFYTWGNDVSGSLLGAGGVGGLVAINDSNGGVYHPVYDVAGNITALVDLFGNEVAYWKLGPFGEVLEDGGRTDLCPLGFATKYTDEETGLVYFGHRYYSPQSGRWLSREPLGEFESFNLYAYCHNDPVGKVDYLGLEELHQNAPSVYELQSRIIALNEIIEQENEMLTRQWYSLVAGSPDLSISVSTSDDERRARRSEVAALQYDVETHLLIGEDGYRTERSKKILLDRYGTAGVYNKEIRNRFRGVTQPETINADRYSPAVSKMHQVIPDVGLAAIDLAITGPVPTFSAGRLGGMAMRAGPWRAPRTTPNLTTGRGFDAGDTPVRIDGQWSVNDMKQGLLGHPPRGLGSPDLHHGGQMPGGAKHEIIPSQHRNNSALHPNRSNQGVTPEMRQSDRQLHWWYRAREQGADQVLPDWIYD